MAEPRRRLRAGALQLSLYGLVGAANTLVGFGVIAALDVGLGASPITANALGYAAGMLCGFLLNRRFVFRSDARMRAVGPKYLAAVMLGFALNQVVLRAGLMLLGAERPALLVAQGGGMISYSAFVFLAFRLLVFARPTGSAA